MRTYQKIVTHCKFERAPHTAIPFIRPYILPQQASRHSTERRGNEIVTH